MLRTHALSVVKTRKAAEERNTAQKPESTQHMPQTEHYVSHNSELSSVAQPKCRQGANGDM